MKITCEVWGSPVGTAPTEQFPDTAADWYAGKPTAVAEVSVTWGRSTTVDQPEPATCSFDVVDPSGGQSFRDQSILRIGEDVHLFAIGNVGTGVATDVALDGSFEAMAVGIDHAGDLVDGRVMGFANSVSDGAGYYNETAIVTTPAAADGVHCSEVRSGPHYANGVVRRLRVLIGPDRWDANGALGAWDAIPTMRLDESWRTRLQIKSAYNAAVTRWLAGMRGPTYPGQWLTIGAGGTHTGDMTWKQSDFERVVDSGQNRWCGTYMEVLFSNWNEMGGSWSSRPGTWAEHYGLWVDDLEVLSPADASRRVRVYSGEITDMKARTRGDGSVRITVTAVDQLGKLMNRYVGDDPWPSEAVPARVDRILADDPPVAFGTEIDDAFTSTVVTRRDIDRQSQGGLLQALATGVDGVLWSATHDVSGPYLWLEDPQERMAVGQFTNFSGTIQIEGAANVDSSLDACWIDADVEWVRDVSDVVTRVDATWLDQSTSPDVTERWIPSTIDTAAEGEHGARHYFVGTQLTAEAAAVAVAQRVLARTRQLQWRTAQLVWDLDQTIAQGDYAATQVALDLLDGTGRIGRGLAVENIANWPEGTTAGMYLDGGEYRFDEEGWHLTMLTTPMAGIGESAVWVDFTPTAWTWSMFDPSIGWDSCWGVAVPPPIGAN